jgi:hypothetical protein
MVDRNNYIFSRNLERRAGPRTPPLGRGGEPVQAAHAMGNEERYLAWQPIKCV